MNSKYTLSSIGANEFQHLVNAVSLCVLGSGASRLGPGPDGGRDGIFTGEAPYPSVSDRWNGSWVIQCKYHSGSENPSTWILRELEQEMKLFAETEDRNWPDNYILATNIELSGTPQSGAYDKCFEIVRRYNPALAEKFAIWSGEKILDFIHLNHAVGNQFAHLLTPGTLISRLHNLLNSSSEAEKRIIPLFVVNGLAENARTKLEQAGDVSDDTAGLHLLFSDIPYAFDGEDAEEKVLKSLTKSASNTFPIALSVELTEEWSCWFSHPSRSRVSFIKGGPGQGKSTTCQFFSQINRAAILLQLEERIGTPREISLAKAIRSKAIELDVWPSHPRIPVHFELKEYASWMARQHQETPKSVITYLKSKISTETSEDIEISRLRNLLAEHRWAFIFDGLDEVSDDVKDEVAAEISKFYREEYSESDCLFICTSRPQGYSGQFISLDPCEIELVPLDIDQALEFARPILYSKRTQIEGDESFNRLKAAAQATSVQELMTSPLQAHIMAIIVKSGQRPPERKWLLFSKFFSVILARESNRDLNDRSVAELLQKDEKLIRNVHSVVGFKLHAYAESAFGVHSDMKRDEFVQLVTAAVQHSKDETESETIIEAVKKASEERLVLISTPIDKTRLRFDVRQLQEFFAAECLHDGISADGIELRLRTIAGDAHWREVTHFLLSALVENNRRPEIALAVQVISDLDSGENATERKVNHKLARGARIVSKLLSDGVLEVDKSLRNMFKNTLAPLAFSNSPYDVSDLITIEGPSSKKWIFDYMLEVFLKTDIQNAYGAAAYVYYVIDESSYRFSEALEKFNNESPEVMSKIISTMRHSSLRPWQSTFLSNKLTDDKWSELILSHTITFENRQRPESLALFLKEIEVNYSKEAAKSISILVAAQYRWRHVTSTECGATIVTRETKLSPEEKKTLDSFIESDVGQSGAIYLFQLLAKQFSQNCRNNALSLLRELFKSKTRMHCISNHALSLIPESSSGERNIEHEIKWLEGITDEEYAKHHLRSNKNARISHRETLDLERFNVIRSYSDSDAFTSWMSALSSGQRNFPDEINQFVIAYLSKNDDNLVFWFFYLGDLVDCNESLIRSKLRNLDIFAGTCSAFEFEEEYFRPFKLEKQEDASILAFLVHSIAHTGQSRRFHRSHSNLGEWQEVISKYTDSKYLKSVIYNDSHPETTKISASLLIAILESNQSFIAEEIESIKKCVSTKPMLALSVSACLNVFQQRLSPDLQSLIWAIYEMTEKHHWIAPYWDSEFATWRELSHRPISTQNVANAWTAPDR